MIRQSFLDAMSLTAAAVTVVTTDGDGGRSGATVTAMTSVSADGDAPMILICVHHRSQTAAAIAENRACSVNILSQEQSFISNVFGGREEVAPEDRFACADWVEGVTGCPRLVGALATLDCVVTGQQRQGTHEVFFCAVRDVGFSGNTCPLVYFGRGYRTLISAPSPAIRRPKPDAPSRKEDPDRPGNVQTAAP